MVLFCAKLLQGGRGPFTSPKNLDNCDKLSDLFQCREVDRAIIWPCAINRLVPLYSEGENRSHLWLESKLMYQVLSA